MKLSSILPPSDLLQKVENVETGLRKIRRLSGIGWIGVMIGAVFQITIAVVQSEWLLELISLNWGEVDWLYLGPIIISLLMLVILKAFAFWIEESQNPFKYTCFVSQFEAVASENEKYPCTRIEPKMSWLSTDIACRLNERLQRIMYLDPKTAEKDNTAVDWSSHICISGTYLIRELTQSSKLEIVVQPRIRIGSPDQPESLVPRVFYSIKSDKKSDLNRSDYEKIVERVYYQVATSIYDRLKEDVKRKIDLLPTNYLKAAAYYWEAQDFANSKALKSYEAAGELFLQTAKILAPYDPFLVTPPKSPLLYLDYKLRGWIRITFEIARRMFAFLPTLQKGFENRQMLLAKAENGYANMQLFRRELSVYLGQPSVSIFETPRFAKRSLDRVRRLRKDVKGRQDHIFNSYATLALAHAALGDSSSANGYLDDAEKEIPHRANVDSVYLLAKSSIAESNEMKLEFLIRAAELYPRFDVVTFARAYYREMVWRFEKKPTAREADADLVIDCYEGVLRENPGNIASLANCGYVEWLLGYNDIALRYFERGEDYKFFIPGTVVSELRYGLAKVYFELGNIVKAFKYLSLAEAADRSYQMSHLSTASAYYFRYIGKDIFTRFEKLKKRCFTIEKQLQKEKKITKPEFKLLTSYILNDYGEACWQLYLRDGDPQYKDKAVNAFNQSIKRNQRNTRCLYNIAITNNTMEGPIKYLEQAVEYEPNNIKIKLRSVYEYTQQILQTSINMKEVDKLNSDKYEIIKEVNKIKSIINNNLPYQVVNNTKDSDKNKNMIAQIAQLNYQLKIVNNNLHEFKEKEEVSKKRLEKAQSEAKSLLPHKWMWVGVGKDQHFNWNSLPGTLLGNRYQKQGKWERELSEHHVEALYSWSSALISAKNIVDPRKFDLAKKLLNHILARFWPNNFDLLYLLYQLEENDGEKIRLSEQLANILMGWIKNDPIHHGYLQWMNNNFAKLGGITFDNKIKIFMNAIKMNASNFVWVLLIWAYVTRGHELFSEKQYKEAAEYYKKAADAAEKLAKRKHDNKWCLEPFENRNEWGLALMRLSTSLNEEDSVKDLVKTIKRGIECYDGWYDIEKIIGERENPVQLFRFRHLIEQQNLKAVLSVETKRSLIELCQKMLPSFKKTTEDTIKDRINVLKFVKIEIDEYIISYVSNDMLDEVLVQNLAFKARIDIEQHYGIRIPEMHFAYSEDADTGTFQILLNEVFVLSDKIMISRNFRTNKIELEKECEPIFQALKKVIRGNLAIFIGEQEVQSLLEGHCNEAYRNDVIGFEAHGHIGFLTAIVQSLVEERVSINEFARIHDVYRELKDSASPNEMNLAIRILPIIRPNLWGNQKDFKRIVLGPQTEAWLSSKMRNVQGREVLILTAKERSSFLSEFNKHINSRNKFVLILKQAKLRKHVWLIIRRKWTETPVLAEQELIHGLSKNDLVIECIDVP